MLNLDRTGDGAIAFDGSFHYPSVRRQIPLRTRPFVGLVSVSIAARCIPPAKTIAVSPLIDKAGRSPPKLAELGSNEFANIEFEKALVTLQRRLEDICSTKPVLSSRGFRSKPPMGAPLMAPPSPYFRL